MEETVKRLIIYDKTFFASDYFRPFFHIEGPDKPILNLKILRTFLLG